LCIRINAGMKEEEKNEMEVTQDRKSAQKTQH
jgi:hypothetical protein